MSSPLRFAVLVRDGPAARAFVHAVQAQHSITGLMVESPAPMPAMQRLRRLLRQRGLAGLVGTLVRRIWHLQDAADQRARLERLLGAAAHAWPAGLSPHTVPSINGSTAHALLAQWQPQLVLVHGTGLLGPQILAYPAHFVNVHWGLAPHYRGVRCIEHTLLAHDLANLGVTLHQPVAAIDAGPVYWQARLALEPDRRAVELGIQLSQLAAVGVGRIVSQLSTHGTLEGHAQDLSQGRLFRSADYRLAQQHRLRQLERRGLHHIAPAPAPLPLLGPLSAE